jgi:large subunit ribosomal protein L24
MEAPLHLSNLAVVCPNCGRPARIGIHVHQDGKKVRYCKKCKEDIE